MPQLPIKLFDAGVRYRLNTVQLPAGRDVTLTQLCSQAGIPCQYTTTDAPEIFRMYVGEDQLAIGRRWAVGVEFEDLDSWQAALRALEALAHVFHHHGARACVCRPGLFTTD